MSHAVHAVVPKLVHFHDTIRVIVVDPSPGEALWAWLINGGGWVVFATVCALVSITLAFLAGKKRLAVSSAAPISVVTLAAFVVAVLGLQNIPPLALQLFSVAALGFISWYAIASHNEQRAVAARFEDLCRANGVLTAAHKAEVSDRLRKLQTQIVALYLPYHEAIALGMDDEFTLVKRHQQTVYDFQVLYEDDLIALIEALQRSGFWVDPDLYMVQHEGVHGIPQLQRITDAMRNMINRAADQDNG